MTDKSDGMMKSADQTERPELAEQFIDEETASANKDQTQQCYYAQCIQGEAGPKESYSAANQRARDHQRVTGHTTGVLGPTYC